MTNESAEQLYSQDDILNIDESAHEHSQYTIYGWFICALGAVFYFYEYLLRVSPSVMTSDLMLNYHINNTGFGFLSGCYHYIYAPMQLFVGVLMDRYGPRFLLLQACLSCVLGTYLFSCSHMLWLAEVGRFMVGFGSAFAFVGVLKLATVWLPPNRFAIVSGMTMALGMIGGLTGENLLTALVARQGWQNTCYVSAVFGVALFVIMYLFLRDGFRSGRAKANKQQLPDMTSAFNGALTIIKNPQMWLNGAIGCLLYLPTVVFADLYGPTFLKQVYHFSDAKAAMVVSAIYLGWATGGFMVGWVSNKLQKRRLPITVGAMMGAVLISLVFYMPSMSPWVVTGLFFVFGMFSSVQVLVFAIGHEISCSKSGGTAIALTNMFVMIGGAVLQPVVGMLLDYLWTGQLAENGTRLVSAGGYQIAFTVLPFGLILTVILSMFLKETYSEDTKAVH